MQSGDTEARVRFTNRARQNPINVVLGYRQTLGPGYNRCRGGRLSAIRPSLMPCVTQLSTWEMGRNQPRSRYAPIIADCSVC